MNQQPPIHRPHASSDDGALPPPVDPPRDPAHHVDALQEIVADIEGFVELWMPRFDQMLDQCSAAPESHADDAQRSSDLDQQRRQWKQQRRLEAQRLKEKADWLTEAWLRLEQEQRSVLQAQAAWKQRGGSSGSAPAPGDVVSGNDVPAGGEASASTASGNADSAHSEIAPTEPGGAASGGGASGGGSRLSTRLSHQAPADQFELLRHAISAPPPPGR